jgi:hypothetical protein
MSRQASEGDLVIWHRPMDGYTELTPAVIKRIGRRITIVAESNGDRREWDVKPSELRVLPAVLRPPSNTRN